MREEKIRGMIIAFIKVFSEYGLDGVSMKKLAAGAEMTESLIYRYFENKEAVIRQCTVHYHEQIERELIAIFSENIDRFDLMPFHVLNYIDSVIDITRFLLQVMAHPAYSSIMAETKRQVDSDLEKFGIKLSKRYGIDEDMAKGTAMLLNSIVNDYILKESKDNFIAAFRVLEHVIKTAPKSDGVFVRLA